MKVWRQTMMIGGTKLVRYVGMFQCICGGKYPTLTVGYDPTLMKMMSKEDMRQYVREKRENALFLLEQFALESTLCGEHDNRESSPKDVDREVSKTDVDREVSRVDV
jgi:hypothetical protein